MAHLSDRFGFDLADAFAGDIEDLAYIFEGSGISRIDPEAEPDDLGFTVGQSGEDGFDFVPL